MVWTNFDKQKLDSQTWRESCLKIIHYLMTISQVYQQAVDAMPDPELLTNFGSFLFNRGHTQRAEALYREALAADPNFLVAKDR